MRFLLIFAVCASAAHAAPNPFLAQAKLHFDRQEYESCVKRLHQAAQAESTTHELAEVELYSGLCRINLGKKQDALEHFRIARQLAPDIKLPPYSSPKIVQLFREAAPKPAPRVEARLLPKPSVVEPRPTEPLVLTQPPPPPRVLKPWMPWALGGGAALAAGLAMGFGLQAKALESEANATTFQSSRIAQGDAAVANVHRSNVSTGVAVALGVGAALTWFLEKDVSSSDQKARNASH